MTCGFADPLDLHPDGTTPHCNRAPGGISGRFHVRTHPCKWTILCVRNSCPLGFRFVSHTVHFIFNYAGWTDQSCFPTEACQRRMRAERRDLRGEYSGLVSWCWRTPNFVLIYGLQVRCFCRFTITRMSTRSKALKYKRSLTTTLDTCTPTIERLNFRGFVLLTAIGFSSAVPLPPTTSTILNRKRNTKHSPNMRDEELAVAADGPADSYTCPHCRDPWT